MKECLAKITGIETKLKKPAEDFLLTQEIAAEIASVCALDKERLSLSLVYLALYHGSELVRHEAAFSIGEYATTGYSFLSYVALHDPHSVVRHEAVLALSSYARRHPSYKERHRFLLEYIAKNDHEIIVRDSAQAALATLNTIVNVKQ